MIPLPDAFYSQPTKDVARLLLGKILVSNFDGERTAGMIMETEAYLVGDPASHAYRSQTSRNTAMFGPAGTAYVYRSYGLHTCFNIVTGSIGNAEAILIRILLPTIGIEVMQQRRGQIVAGKNLCSGPGNLCVAMGIQMSLYGHSLAEPPLFITENSKSNLEDFRKKYRIVEQTRIGISQGKELLLRFTAVSA